MKVYLFNDYSNPDNRILREITEEEILETYYPRWEKIIERVEPELLINNNDDELQKQCIGDFVMVNMAWIKDYE